MIRTTTEVPYDIRDLSKTAIRYADVTQKVMMREEKCFYFIIKEWIMEDDVKIELQARPPKKISYEDGDLLKEYIKDNFNITETGVEKEEREIILGHLIENNKDQVCNTSWELC
jgi:hypothetical protein